MDTHIAFRFPEGAIYFYAGCTLICLLYNAHVTRYAQLISSLKKSFVKEKRNILQKK